MNILIIYSHPYHKSLNSAIAEKIQRTLIESEHKVDFLDLYREDFNPVLTEEALASYSKGESPDPKVLEYQNRIRNAEYLIFVFPVWWTGLPAILKGFIDKVFLPFFAYQKGKHFPKPYLKHLKGAAVFTTMSSPKIYYNCFLKNPIKQGFIKGVLKFSGIKKVRYLSLGMIDLLDSKKAERFLKKVSAFCKKIAN